MTFAKTFAVAFALFLIFTTATEGMSIQRSITDLRCQCTKLDKKQISRSLMDSVELIPSGPHCKNLEVIITLKNGDLVCVDPSAPWVGQMVKKLLERNEQESS